MSLLKRMDEAKRHDHDDRVRRERESHEQALHERRKVLKARAEVSKMLEDLNGHHGVKVKSMDPEDQWGCVAQVSTSRGAVGFVCVLYEDGTFRGSDESPEQDTRDLNIFVAENYVNGSRIAVDTVTCPNPEYSRKRFEEDFTRWLRR